MTTQVHDTLNSGGYLLHLLVVREVCADELLVRGQICGFSDVACPDLRIDAFE